MRVEVAVQVGADREVRSGRQAVEPEILGGVLEGQATDLEIEAREMIRLRDRLYSIYANATGQPIERIARDCDRNKWLDEKEMLEYGLVDKILTTIPRIRKDDKPE